MAISFKAVTTLPDLAPLEVFWKTHQWHPNADWDFFQTIVQTREEVQSPGVIVAYEDERIVALVAGRIEATRMSIQFGYATFGRAAIRQLALVTGGFIGPWEMELHKKLLVFLNRYMEEQRLDLVLIAQVRLGSPLHSALLSAPRYQRPLPARDGALHWMMQLPKTWQEFLQSRSKKHRYWLKRLNNILDRDFPGTWSMELFTSVEQAPVFLRAAEKIADTTYHRGLGVGIRADEQNIRRLQLEAARGQLRGYLLLLNGKPCAFWYCSTFGKTLHLCTTGYDSALRDYELGTVLLMKVFQDHCGSATDVVDFGLGDAGYKQRFGTESYTETTFFVFSHTTRGSWLRAAIALTTQGNILARRLLDKLQLTQLLKTFWRQKLSAHRSEAPNASPGTEKTANNKGDEP